MSRSQYLEALGLDAWVPRVRLPLAGKAAAAVALPAEPANGQPAASLAQAAPAQVEDSWQGLRTEVAACRRCGLCEGRTQTVFGVGDTAARWLVIGEAPGEQEDLAGEPFVGPAGQLLDKMLLAIDLPRPSVFIANILKCRPPGNRDPRPEEVAQCLPYLARQIQLIRPTLILCVGRIAAQTLLQTETPLGRLRGRVHAFGPLQTPLIVTYHPAYLLRTPAEKRKAWEDLKFARQTFDQLTANRPDGHRT